MMEVVKINWKTKREMNPTASRYLVVDYINYRLTKQGITWANCPPLLSQPTEIHTTLRKMGDEFEERYAVQFSDLGSQLNMSQYNAYPTFNTAVGELFHDGVNWGRIVALFAFSGTLAKKFCQQQMMDLVSSLIDWTSQYLDNQLENWIESHGGWDGFVEFYEKGNTRRRESPWDNISGVIKYGMLGAIGAVALGAILTQRT
ncbi:apoptosis regulator R1-like isoform X1 [Mizuhopecten yessoensis]|uniref:Apoptosis regulator R1 n=1 Tax=Mizuhopecten yessoensis TaxID=6573 RepID=A0A210QQK5_MIZYE|nr:apoptosis regulator R1-like isoform X1 [Mizuhopecten yessoensis]OWF51020.1 Apoptosis regulator R1 [Mizuhopecten yessoensis]